MLMPCFQPNQAFLEGIILGRLLAGYGELELTMCQCMMATRGGDFDQPIRRVFGERGGEKRIKNARKDLLPDYTQATLQDLLTETLDDLEWCRQIRNQYAHCFWYWTQAEGLCFVNLEELAQQSGAIGTLMANRHPIDAALLGNQEAFFFYVKESFTHLADAYKSWMVKSKMPLRPVYGYPKPDKVGRPTKHN